MKERVIYAKVGRREHPIFSADASSDKVVFEAQKINFIQSCIREGRPMPSFREEVREGGQ